MILARTCSTAIPLLLFIALSRGSDLQLNREDVFETHGLSVLLFHNVYHGVFGDEKMSGLEIILHDQRIATNGDVRLSHQFSMVDITGDLHEQRWNLRAES